MITIRILIVIVKFDSFFFISSSLKEKIMFMEYIMGINIVIELRATDTYFDTIFIFIYYY